MHVLPIALVVEVEVEVEVDTDGVKASSSTCTEVADSSTSELMAACENLMIFN